MDQLRLLENESGGSCVDRALEENTLDDMSVDWSTRGIPNEILDRIFRLLDQQSLRQTRLVCTVWNNVALGILSKTPGSVRFLFKKDADGNVNETKVGRIQKLHSILQWTNFPEMFFTELDIGAYGMRDVVCLQREIQLIHLLRNFGSTLKSLELNEVTLHSSILRPLLEMWCANLEELSCRDITVIEDNVTVQSLEMSPNPIKLNLRKSTFYFTRANGATQDMIALIMKLSPKLRSLDVWDLVKSDIWKKINLLPSVTENLEEAIFSTRDELTDLSLISDISFSKKLKSLELLLEKPKFPKEQLVRFLETVPESLERLCLHLEDNKHDYKIEFPLMKNLKVMEHSHGGELCYDSMDVLEKFPNLEILRMTSPSFTDMNPEFPDSLFSNSSYLTTHPHTNLNTLSIDEPVQNPATIFSINQMLPNLRELSLELCIFEISEPTQESWLITIFTGLSEMKKLSTLNLFFRPSFEFNSSIQAINFEACFKPLQDSQALKELKIGCDMFDHVIYYFPTGLEKVFVRIPTLKMLTLNNFEMKFSDLIHLSKTLDRKGILLKVDDD